MTREKIMGICKLKMAGYGYDEIAQVYGLSVDEIKTIIKEVLNAN